MMGNKQDTQHIFKGKIVEEEWTREYLGRLVYTGMFGEPFRQETERERIARLMKVIENPEKAMRVEQTSTDQYGTMVRQMDRHGEAKVAKGDTVTLDGKDVTVTEVAYDANRDRYTYITDLILISGSSTVEGDKEAFIEETRKSAFASLKEALITKDARENLYPKFLKEDYEPISYHRGQGNFKVGHLFQIRVEGYGRYQQYYNAVVTRRAPNTITFRMYRLDDIVIGEAKPIKFKMDIDGHVLGWKMRHLDADKVYIRFKQIEDDTL